MAAAKALTIVAGSEIAFDPDARAALTALAERLQAPILLEDRRTFQAAAIHGDHPAFAGTYALAHPAVANADLLFYAGMFSFVEFEEQRGPFQPPDAQIVHLCSDPAEIGKLADVDVGLAANAELGLHDLFAAVGTVASDARAHTATKRSLPTVARPMKRRADATRAVRPDADPPGGAGRGTQRDASARLLHRQRRGYDRRLRDRGADPRTARANIMASAGGSLGWGMGAAIGVQLALPEARVVNVTGDGSFQFGLQALFTAQQLGLPITTIVVDNTTYAAVRAAMKRYRAGARNGAYPASDLRGPDIAAIARGFGAYAETVEDIAGLQGALDRAFAATGPSVIVVKTDPEHTGP